MVTELEGYTSLPTGKVDIDSQPIQLVQGEDDSSPTRAVHICGEQVDAGHVVTESYLGANLIEDHRIAIGPVEFKRGDKSAIGIGQSDFI